MIINKILNTLPDEYRHFHSAWDSVQEKDKTINNLMARLQIEEARIKPNVDEEIAEAHVARKKPDYLKKVKCHNCGKYRHMKKDCWKKENKIEDSQRCFECGKRGHVKKDCWTLQKKNESSEKENKSKAKGLIARAILVSKKQLEEKRESSQEWYVDSGATKHMTNERNVFEKYVKFKEK